MFLLRGAAKTRLFESCQAIVIARHCVCSKLDATKHHTILTSSPRLLLFSSLRFLHVQQQKSVSCLLTEIDAPPLAPRTSCPKKASRSPAYSGVLEVEEVEPSMK